MFITPCVLCYGPYPQLHQRVLDSVASCIELDDRRNVEGVRIGISKTKSSTDACLKDFVRRMSKVGVRVHLFRFYWFGEHAYKYPAMRSMLYGSKLGPPKEYAMWLDDDSFLETGSHWFETVSDYLNSHQPDAAGMLYKFSPSESQRKFIRQQAWSAPNVEFVHNRLFVQGGFQLLRMESIRKLNWPWFNLRHCGGDSLLGEAMAHAGMRVLSYPTGYSYNAGKSGTSDTSQRRGYSELPLGADSNDLLTTDDIMKSPHYNMVFHESIFEDYTKFSTESVRWLPPESLRAQ